MFWRKTESQMTSEILELLKQQQVTVTSTPPATALFSPKNLNALVIAAIIGLVAFIWTSVTQQPQKNAEQSTQITEIRTTVLGIKNDLSDFKNTLNNQQKDMSDLKSRVDTNATNIDALKKNVQDNADRLTQLEKDTR